MPPRTKGKAVVEKANKSLERLAIEYVPIGSIRPNDYNPNRQSEHEYELLRKSVEEDGFTQPVLVAEDRTTIVDGEHRWRVMQDLGHEDIPIVVVPMGVAQAKIATLRHNRARGSEDIELATDVLRDLERLGALDWAADSLDLSDAELQRLLDDIPASEALAGETFGEAWTPATGTENPGARGEVAPGTYADSTDAGAQAARDRQASAQRSTRRRRAGRHPQGPQRVPAVADVQRRRGRAGQGGDREAACREDSGVVPCRW